MAYEVIPNADTHNLERKSSISQHRGILSVIVGGEHKPLVSSYIDGVKCGKIYSHKIAVTDRPGIGYSFPVGTCKYVSDIYLLGQQNETVKKRLPEWFGIGFYNERIKQDVFLNADNGALGTHNEYYYRVGKDYVVAKEMLAPAE